MRARNIATRGIALGIVELFCDNLQRFEAGLPLRNRIDAREFY